MPSPLQNGRENALFGFIIGSVITAAAMHMMSSSSKPRKDRHEKNDDEIKESTTPRQEPKKNDVLSLPSEFREEQLSRNTLFFGQEGMKHISGANVAVVGLGGVGSHAAHMLARAGIGNMRLIDFDQVTLSSLNRHAVATLEDVGIPKVDAMKRHLEKICGTCCRIDSRAAMYSADDEEDLLGDQKFDFIVDAIDDVTTKAQLLAYCVKTGTRVISCTGAGGKSDVTRIHIGDLPSACHDPLAAKIRLYLKRMKVSLESELINIVYSSEKTVVPLAALTDEQKKSGPGEFGAVDNMRVRVLPVLGTMPAIMGQACAAYALCEIGGKPFSPLSGERMGRNVRHRLFQHFKNREKKIRTRVEGEDNKDPTDSFDGHIVEGTWVGPVQVDADDVEYMMCEVWRNRCAVSGARLGNVLELTRWDLSKPSTCSNLVLMSMKEIQKFDETGQAGIDADVRKNIEMRLASCKIDKWA